MQVATVSTLISWKKIFANATAYIKEQSTWKLEMFNWVYKLSLLLSITAKTVIGDHVRILKCKISLRRATLLVLRRFYDPKNKKKLLYCRHILLVISTVKDLFKHFIKKGGKRHAKKNSVSKKYSKEKAIDCTTKRRDNSFNNLIKMEDEV